MMSRVILVLILTFATSMEGLPSEGTTTRSSKLQDSRKIDTNIPKPANNVLLDILDVRTPPKIKLQQDKKKYEQSHPGVAIPIDEDSIDLDDSATKKYNFYKLEKSTTESSISTWILLSGQAAVTTKASTLKPSTPVDVIVPIYSRTKKPIEVEATSVNNDKIRFTEINKVAVKNKKKPAYTTTEASSSKKPIEQTTTIKNKNKINYTTSTTETALLYHTNVNKTAVRHKKKPEGATTSSTESLKKITESSSTVAPINRTNVTVEHVNNTLVSNSSTISLESKDGSIVLSNEKKKKTTHKKKKNKRRKKPANKSTTNIESPIKIKKQKNAIGTQIYSYLSREIVPTLGVGLVGLMVTAGLAGYFLFPFGAARRNINIDRNDKDNYFYKDEYSGGMLEEDAIGQVIAGMPSNSLYPSSKSSATKNPYLSKIYRSNHQSPIQYNQQYSKSSENVAALFEREDDKKVDVKEDKNNNEVNNSTRFVVGSVHNEALEEVTPVTVPEHGPRSLRSRSTDLNLKKVLGIIN